MGLAADVVIAKGYFDWQGSGVVSVRRSVTVLKRPGILPLLAKLLGWLLLWFAVALIVPMLVTVCRVVPHTVAGAMQHPGVRTPTPHTATLVIVLTWLVAYAILTARYALVLSCFAVARPGRADYLQAGVRLANPILRILLWMNVVECLLWYLPSSALRHGWHATGCQESIRQAFILLLTGALGTYFELVKTELTLRQVEATAGLTR